MRIHTIRSKVMNSFLLFFRLLFHTTQNPARVIKSQLNGSEVVEIASSGLQEPWGLAVDITAKLIWWADSGKFTNHAANIMI